MARDAPTPTFKDVVVSRLRKEARELRLLAWMLENGYIGSARELREDYIPHRIRALEDIATRGRGNDG